MKSRVHERLETFKSLKENNLKLAYEEAKKVEDQLSLKESFKDNYYIIKDMKARKDRTRSNLMEAARNDALATCLKAIYITALEAETLTDDGIILAESMVDRWIAENGGASVILNKASNTYLNSRIAQIVEEAARESVRLIESTEEDDDNEKKETKAEKKDNAVDVAKDFIKNASKNDVKEFISKVVDNIQKTSEDKGEEKAEKKQEKEAQSAEEPTTDKTPAEEPENTSAPVEPENAEKEEPAKEPKDGENSEDEISIDDNNSDDTKSDETPSEDSGDDKSEDPDNSEASIEEPSNEDPAEPTEGENEGDGAISSDETSESSPEEPEESAESSEQEEKEKEPEPSEEPVDNSEQQDDSETADQDSTVDDVPASDEDVKPTDTENGTPDTDPISDDTDSEDPLNDIDDQSEDNTEDERSSGESSEDSDIDISNKEVDPNENPNEDDDVNDTLGEPLDPDGQDSDITIDGDTENKGEIFDELDKEEDVQKAIELIKTRVADAEETFIRNNAEDKKKMDEIISKISNNVKTIEDINKPNSTESKIAEESVRMNKRRMDAIRDNRPLTIFEKMSRNLTRNILKDTTVMEAYTMDGKLDTALVVESAKVMYGWLETVNTLQLDRVDSKYIENILNGMN